MKKNVILGLALMSGLLGDVQVVEGMLRNSASCGQFVSNILRNQGSTNSGSAAFSANGETSISGVINTYTKVTSFGCNSITVASASGYNPGDTVLVIQMKGASIDTISNTSAFGSILKYNEAGNYEFNIIKSISGNIIYLQNALLKSYDPSGMVQLISVPCYNNVTISGTLTALPWNGDTGGVLVFNAAGTVTLNGNIDVSGAGFRGGTASVNCSNGVCSKMDYYYAMATGWSGQKGEGIAAYGLTYTAGRGALGNGGGGGNMHNGGGGGGGNYGSGGRGGDEWDGCGALPLGGDGGKILLYSNTQNKVFLGGGGGGGSQNDYVGTAGTNGGGIIIIKANTIAGNNNSIISNGNDNALFAGIDAAGGGGAGGTILLDVLNYSQALNIKSTGGKGGSINASTGTCWGPGGGGSGGLLWTNGTTLPGNVTAQFTSGLPGVFMEVPCTNSPYGATSGDLGGIVYDLQLVQSNIPATPIPTITVSPDPALVCNGDSVSLTASGATSYLWSNGLGTSKSVFAKPTSTTIYTVTGTMSGCIGTKNITVTVKPKPTVSISASAGPICAGTSVTITTNGAANYSWSGGLGNTNTITVSPTSTTTYTATGTTTGCSDTASTTVTVNPTPTINISASANPICTGNSTTLTASGATAYLWNGGLGNTNSITVSPTSTTTYAATGTTAGCTGTAETTVTVNPNLTVSISASANPICAGTSATLTASGATTYTWNGGLGNSNSITVSPTTTTTYTVTGTSPGCTGTTSTTLTVNPNVTVSVSATANPICAGTSVTITANGAANYSWSGGLGNTNTITVSPISTTTYTATGTTTGCSDTASTTVTVNPIPTINISASANPICTGNSTTLTASGATAYLWNGGLGNTNSITVSPTSTTTYAATGTTAGCTGTAETTVTVNPNLTVSISASANPICAGTSATLTASGATTYTWNGGLGNSNSITVSPTTTTTYTVTGTSPGCTGTTSTTVTVNSNPTVNITASNGQIVINAADGTPPYQYSINGIDFQSSEIFTNIQEGSYTAFTKDINNCITSNKITVGGEMITIPNFFTPNNDGFHDTWEIKGIQSYPDATIQVFDRFGKLLTTYKGSDTGWNGIYKNNPLPSDDYWYVVKLKNNIDPLKGHVTLKR